MALNGHQQITETIQIEAERASVWEILSDSRLLPQWVPAVEGEAEHPAGHRDVEVHVSDLLIRDVPDEVVAAIEAKARRLGLSRTEYLRRDGSRGGHWW